MKSLKYLLLYLLCSIVVFTAKSQHDWSLHTAELTAEGPVRTYFTPIDNQLLMLTRYRTMLINQESGTIEANYKTPHALDDVWFHNQNHLLANNKYKMLLYSDLSQLGQWDVAYTFPDHVEGWKVEFLHVKDIYISESGHGVLLGFFYTYRPGSPSRSIKYIDVILKTANHGKQWSLVYYDTDEYRNRLYSLSYSGSAYYVFSSKWHILTSTDLGQSWSKYENPNLTQYEMNDLDVLSDSLMLRHWFTEDNKGRIFFKSTDQGATWDTLWRFSTYQIDYNPVDYGFGQDHFFWAYNGDSLWTGNVLDGTIKGQKIPPTHQLGFRLMDIKDNGQSVLATDGSDGMLVSEDGGRSFRDLNPKILPRHTDFNYFQHPSPGLKDDGSLFLTSRNMATGLYETRISSDDGCDWEYLRATPNPYLCFGSKNHYLMVHEGKYQVTKDGGQTWIPSRFHFRSPGPPVFEGIYAMRLFDENYGVAISGVKSIFVTRNGGESWVERKWDFSPGIRLKDVVDIAIPSGKVAYAMRGYSSYFKTTDGGYNWKLNSVGSWKEIIAIHFVDEQIGFVTVKDNNPNEPVSYQVLRTTNGGDDWNIVRELPYSGASINFLNAKEGYIGGANGMLLHTLDSGATWQILPAMTERTIKKIAFLGQDIMLHTDGGVFKADKPLAAQITPMASTGCPEIPVLFKATQSINAHYQWVVNGQPAGTTPTLNYQFNESGDHQVSLEVSGCTNDESDQSTLNYFVKPRPAKPVMLFNRRAVQGTIKHVCDGDRNYLVTLEKKYAQYQWGNGRTAKDFFFRVNEFDRISVKVWDSTGCFVASDTVFTKETPDPIARFSYTLGDDLVFNFLNESSHADKYYWNIGGLAFLEDEQNPQYKFRHHGTYPVSLRVTNPCGDDWFRVEVPFFVTGLDEDGLGKQKPVFPNPTRGLITVKTKDMPVQYADLLGPQGKLIKQLYLNADGQFSLEGLPPGIYTLKAYTTNNAHTYRVAKE